MKFKKTSKLFITFRVVEKSWGQERMTESIERVETDKEVNLGSLANPVKNIITWKYLT